MQAKAWSLNESYTCPPGILEPNNVRFFSNILLKIAGLSYHSPIIPMLRSQRQEDLEFEASLNYIATLQSEAKQISLFLCCEPGCLHLPCITFLLLHPPFLGINQRAAAESCPESLTCFSAPWTTPNQPNRQKGPQCCW